MLARHADHDRAFQRRVLVLLRKAVAGGEASGQQLAYLSDRVSIADTGIQLYGTQLRSVGPCELDFEPLDDRGQVEARRKAVGLMPLEEYRQALQAHALPESCRAKPPTE